MTLFDKMRRAFGLASDDDESEAFRDDLTTTGPCLPDASPVTDPDHDTEAPDNNLHSDSTAADDDAADVAAEMMAGVVELFNSFQPEFISKCLDADRQRTLLADSMAPALRQRLAAIIASEKERVCRINSDERAALDADLKKLRERNAELERRRTEFKDEQLSANRQKRALKERVHDLETQVEKLEGEKEQLDLENRSMANKLRASGVTAQQSEAPVPVGTEELDKAKREAAENASKLRAIASEHAKAVECNEAMKERCKVADDMIADLRQRLTAAEEAAAASETAAAQAREALEKASKCNVSREEADELRRQVELLQGIAEQAEKFADVAEKKDARIAELKLCLKEAEKDRLEIARLESENRSLRSTIEANLYEHASEISDLRRRLEESKPRRGRPRKPRNDNEAGDKPAETEEKTHKSKQPKISAIDELIESNEWLMAPTPEELVPKAEEPSDDFGYHAPVHRTTIHDDSSQLTLF